MEFSYEVKDSYAEVKADGRLNMVSAPKLREFVTDVIAGGSNRIVVNLENTAFMDSSGLGALIGCLKAARQAGGRCPIARSRSMRLTAPSVVLATGTCAASSSSESVWWPMRAWRLRSASRQ